MWSRALRSRASHFQAKPPHAKTEASHPTQTFFSRNSARFLFFANVVVQAGIMVIARKKMEKERAQRENERTLPPPQIC